MASEPLGEIDGLGAGAEITWSEGVWSFDEDDFLLLALLQDPIYAAELCFQDPKNTEYSGCYRVRDYQYPLFRIDDHYAGAACGRSTGKALANDAPVLTPAGYRPISDLQIGDMVVGSNGLPTPVLGVYPQGMRDIYAVTFRDGTVVECDGDHLWTVTCDHWQSRGHGCKTVRLKEMAATKMSYRVPLPTRVVEFAERPTYPQDPWLVGALLGDGNLTRPGFIRFASVDPENIERLEAALPDDAELAHDGGCNYRIRSREYVYAQPGVKSAGRKPHELLEWSRASGLQGKAAHEKRVPEELLWGSPTERQGVLAGLVDTDGYIDPRSGGAEICTVSPGLAEDIRHLVWSLGGTASIREKKTTHRVAYRVQFRIPHVCPARLERKCAAWRKGDSARTVNRDWRSISSIHPVGQKPATCIEVAAEDGLFMTSNMVLTHNTESIRARAFSHPFRRIGLNLLLTAPELIHLYPLTDAIEGRLRDTRLTREFLDMRGGKTGFTHRPFGVEFLDGTKIIGRIPRLTGVGVKGQHQPDLIIDEAQDYPEKGWIEVNETVMRETVDYKGDPDFHYHFYGVHSGARDSRFHDLIEKGEFRIINVTALQRPDWNATQKANAKAMYGGTSSPDYRRNILGEAGAAASQMFVTGRLIACLDQDRESDYNTKEYKHQLIRVEEFDEYLQGVTDEDWLGAYSAYLDLPDSFGTIYAGSDIGLTISPTEIMVFSHEEVGKVPRMKLLRRYTLERFREIQIRRVYYALAWHFGQRLEAFGIDATGLGKPIFQGIEDDPNTPQRLLDVARGYFFNAKVPVDVDPDFVMEDTNGHLRDQYGSAVKKEVDPLTNQERLVTYMSFIEASTKYLRDWVDSGFLLLPFDTEITTDMQGETQQRIQAVGKISGNRKPNAFHILDAMRGAAMGWKAEEVEEKLEFKKPEPVMDIALDISDPVGMGGMF